MKRPSKPATEGPKGTQSLGRAVDILHTVALLQGTGATLPVILKATALSRSTAFRILRFLCAERLLAHDAETGTYHIGPWAFELGLAARLPPQFDAVWRPALQRISVRLNLTSYLLVRSGLDVVCLADAEVPSNPHPTPLRTGWRLPLGIGAGSLAILATLDAADVDRILEANSQRFIAYGNDGLTPDLLRTRVERARTHGFAFSEGSVAAGGSGIAMVIPSPGTSARIAVSVAAPSAIFRPEEIPAIVATLRDIIGALDTA